MFQGEVVSIFIAASPTATMQSVDSARAEAGKGFAGDRYFDDSGTFAKPGVPDYEATLIEIEAIEAAAAEYNVEIASAETRRNLVTRGVPLNHLVGRMFTVGEVAFRGIRLCEPCSHLEKLTREGVRKSLIHRGGLRAQILSTGTLRVGDIVTRSISEG